MFYQMITNARNRWLASPQCSIKNLITYMESVNQMRDAQIDAIKTYLFLKIACHFLLYFKKDVLTRWIYRRWNFLAVPEYI